MDLRKLSQWQAEFFCENCGFKDKEKTAFIEYYAGETIQKIAESEGTDRRAIDKRLSRVKEKITGLVAKITENI